MVTDHDGALFVLMNVLCQHLHVLCCPVAIAIAYVDAIIYVKINAHVSTTITATYHTI